MSIKLHLLDDNGKYIETQILESDKEESAKQHRSIYNLPDVKYTRVNPPKEREGLERYFDGEKWVYREQEIIEEEDAE